jgi:aminoglycoside 3-N-acetyltransferase I
VAAANGKVLDGLVAYEFDKVERTRREVYIYDLAVAAEHRRRHLATGLRVNGGGILGRSAE